MSSGLPAAVADWLFQVVQPIYEDPKHVFHDSAEVLDKYRHLRPRTRVFTSFNGQPELLLCIYGNVKVNEQLEVPVLVWVPRRYPREFPYIYIDLEALGRNRQLKLSKHLDSNGRLYLSLAERWDPYRSSLVQVIRHLSALFSRAPPLTDVYVQQPAPVQQPVLAPSDPPEDPSCAPRVSAPPLPPKSQNPIDQQLGNMHISPSVQANNGLTPTQSINTASPPPLPPAPSSASAGSADTATTQWSRPPGPPPPLDKHIAGPNVPSGGATVAPSLPARPQRVPETPHVRINDEVRVFPAEGTAVPTVPTARPPVLPERPTLDKEPEVDLLDIGDNVQGESEPHARAINELKKSMLEMLSYDKGYGRDQVQSRVPHIQVAVTQFDDMYAQEAQRMNWMAQSIAASKMSLESEIAKVDRETERVHEFIAKNGREMDPDKVITAETLALNQLYELVARDRAITDTIHALSRLLNCGALEFDQFVKKVRELARSQFTTRLHIRKIVDLLEA